MTGLMFRTSAAQISGRSWFLLSAVKFSAGPEPRREQQLLSAADAFCCHLLTRHSGILTLNNLEFIMYGEEEHLSPTMHSVFSLPCRDGIMIPRKSQGEVVSFVFLTTELLRMCLTVSLILATRRQHGLTAGRRKGPELQQKTSKMFMVCLSSRMETSLSGVSRIYSFSFSGL